MRVSGELAHVLSESADVTLCDTTSSGFSGLDRCYLGVALDTSGQRLFGFSRRSGFSGVTPCYVFGWYRNWAGVAAPFSQGLNSGIGELA